MKHIDLYMSYHFINHYKSSSITKFELQNNQV